MEIVLFYTTLDSLIVFLSRLVLVVFDLYEVLHQTIHANILLAPPLNRNFKQTIAQADLYSFAQGSVSKILHLFLMVFATQISLAPNLLVALFDTATLLLAGLEQFILPFPVNLKLFNGLVQFDLSVLFDVAVSGAHMLPCGQILLLLRESFSLPLLSLKDVQIDTEILMTVLNQSLIGTTSCETDYYEHLSNCRKFQWYCSNYWDELWVSSMIY